MSIRDRLGQLFDLPILSHGFAPYQRDYRIESEIGDQGANRIRQFFPRHSCKATSISMRTLPVDSIAVCVYWLKLFSLAQT
jgi:hypothetical protein